MEWTTDHTHIFVIIETREMVKKHEKRYVLIGCMAHHAIVWGWMDDWSKEKYEHLLYISVLRIMTTGNCFNKVRQNHQSWNIWINVTESLILVEHAHKINSYIKAFSVHITYIRCKYQKKSTKSNDRTY